MPATLATFISDHASPQPSGTAIVWTATAIGSIPPIQYRFERQDGGIWSIVQAYGTSSSYTWTPASGDVGDHAVRVSVRNSGSIADFEDTRMLAMTITSGSGMAAPEHRGMSLLAALHPSQWLMRLFARPAGSQACRLELLPGRVRIQSSATTSLETPATTASNDTVGLGRGR